MDQWLIAILLQSFDFTSGQVSFLDDGFDSQVVDKVVVLFQFPVLENAFPGPVGPNQLIVHLVFNPEVEDENRD